MPSRGSSARPASTARPRPGQRTIAFAELRRLAFANSKRLPQVVEIAGERYRWVGIGWVNEGEPQGDEVLVTD